MNSVFKLLGYTPGQWWSVFAKYPPTTMDFRGVQESRMMWMIDNLAPPPDRLVTEKFLHHWEKFCGALKVVFWR